MRKRGIKMKWLKTKLRKWLIDDGSNQVEYAVSGNKISIGIRDEPSIDGLRFVVMRATGGIILQSRTYDRRKDDERNTTYIITDDEPVAERVGQIVSMEILKL